MSDTTAIRKRDEVAKHYAQYCAQKAVTQGLRQGRKEGFGNGYKEGYRAGLLAGYRLAAQADQEARLRFLHPDHDGPTCGGCSYCEAVEESGEVRS
jgi:hypothetical protein